MWDQVLRTQTFQKNEKPVLNIKCGLEKYDSCKQRPFVEKVRTFPLTFEFI